MLQISESSIFFDINGALVMYGLIIKYVFLTFVFSSAVQAATRITKCFAFENTGWSVESVENIEPYLPAMAKLSYDCSLFTKFNYEDREIILKTTYLWGHFKTYLMFDNHKFGNLIGYVIVLSHTNRRDHYYFQQICNSSKFSNALFRPASMIGSVSDELYQKYSKLIEDDMKVEDYNGILLYDLSTDPLTCIKGFEAKEVNIRSSLLCEHAIQKYLLRPENVNGIDYTINIWTKNF